MNKELIINLLADRPIAYHPDFARCFGGIQAGLLLSQLFYWCNRGRTEWIYKTQAELTYETGMTRCEQETARKRLKSINAVEEKLKGSPPKIHYKINFDIVFNLLEIHYLNCENLTNQFAENPQINLQQLSKSSITENTSKNTSESTTKITPTASTTNNGTEYNKCTNIKEGVNTFVPISNFGSKSKSISDIEGLRSTDDDLEPFSVPEPEPDELTWRRKKPKSAGKKREPALHKIQVVLQEIGGVLAEVCPRVLKYFPCDKVDARSRKAVEKLQAAAIDAGSYTRWYFTVEKAEFKAWAYFVAPGFMNAYESWVLNSAPVQVKSRDEQLAELVAGADNW